METIIILLGQNLITILKDINDQYKIFLIEEDCTLFDSDKCLSSSPLWEEDSSCADFTRLCEIWDKDMKRCCPHSCQSTQPFTESNCNNSTGKGTCTYPNHQCDKKYQQIVNGKYRQ